MSDLPPQGPRGGWPGWEDDRTTGSRFSAPSGDDLKGFFGSLFDFSFRSFITGKLIRVIYVLAVAGIGLWALVLLLGALASGEPGPIVFALIGAPLAFLLAVVYVRVGLELVIVLFRIGEDVRTIAASSQQR